MKRHGHINDGSHHLRVGLSSDGVDGAWTQPPALLVNAVPCGIALGGVLVIRFNVDGLRSRERRVSRHLDDRCERKEIGKCD